MAAILRALFQRVPVGSVTIARNSASVLYCQTAGRGLKLRTNHVAASELDLAQEDVEVSTHNDSVIVDWKAQNAWSKFHYLWLRDNCSCPHCLHADTNQRLLDTFKIPLDVRPSHVELTEDKMHVRWEDGHVSKYPMKWLIENSYEHEGMRGLADEPWPVELWGKEIASNPPEVEYSKVMESDQELLKWMTNVKIHGFCFVRGVPVTAEETRKLLVDKIGAIRNTIFGQFWTFPSDLTKIDSSNTAQALDVHTDCCFFEEAPGFEALHCLYRSGTGGMSILLDGFKVAEEIRKSNPEHFYILSSLPLSYHLTGSGHKYLNTTPSIVLDPETGQVTRVHFNNSRRLPLSSSDFKSLLHQAVGGDSPIQKLYGALQTFMATMRSESLEYKFQLEPGNLLTFDNHRLMHARTAYTGLRQMCGCHINKEEWVSRLRVLREKYGD